MQQKSFEEFIEMVSEPGRNSISPSRFSITFDIPLFQLARESGVDEVTLQQHPESQEVQRYLKNNLKVLSAACAIKGNVSDAMYWIRNSQIDAFNNKTARELVSEGRINDLIDYLESISPGFVG